MNYNIWSEAEIEIARRLWNEEGKTAEQIASAILRQLGIRRTRSAVLGRINRMPGIFLHRGKSGGARDLVQAKRIAKNRAAPETEALAERSDLGNAVDRPAKPVARIVRTVSDMIAGTGAGLSRREDGKPVRAKPLVDLDPRECRFPVAGDQPATVLFCAAEIHPDDWRPWTVGGCYCHRHKEIASAGFSSPGSFVGRRTRAA